MSVSKTGRRGFSLLEVMVALAILMMSLVILVETQSTAAWATREAERVVIGTDLAEAKLAEALMRVEMEGFTEEEFFEHGDFDDLGDEALNVEMGPHLKDFHWEYAMQEIDVALAGDIASMASEALGGDGGGGDDAGGLPGVGAIPGLPGGMGGLGALLSPEMLSQMLSPYIREVRVRVYWAGDSREAEENGTEIILTTHVINPSGELVNLGNQALTQ